MFRKIAERLKLKELELKTVRSKLKGNSIKERYKALMKFEPLKHEITELRGQLTRRKELLNNKEK